MTTILRQAPATVLWDSACRLLGTAAVQPWAFLGHTHRLGRLVTGWRVAGAGGGDMAWAGLGSTDPTLPQSFRPVHSGRNQGFLSNGCIGCIYLVKILAHYAMLQCISRYNKPP